MMQPTPEYLAAPEISRTRPEASHGPVEAVIENFHDKQHPVGKSMVYLSIDNGVSFQLLDWRVHWRSWWKKLGREWPPCDLHIEKLDDAGLHVSYFEATYDGPVDYKASYLFADKRWHLS